MGLESLVASGVALADRITASLQGTVEHHVFKELDGRGRPVHWEPHDNVQAVITYGQVRVSRTDSGETVPPKVTLAFPRPIAVHPLDKFVLPDRTTGPVVKIDGEVNPSSGMRYATFVGLG